MTDPEQNERELALNVFAVSAGMVGVCLTSIGILRLLAAQQSTQTICDNLLAIDALIFVLSCGLAFWFIRTSQPRMRRRLRYAMDFLFLAGLVGMTAICAMIAYTLL